jgi:hypothetical protein
MKSVGSNKNKIVLMLLTLSLSIGVSYVTSKDGKFPFPEAVIIGTLVFIALEITQVAFFLASLHFSHEKEADFWNTCNQIASQFLSITKHSEIVLQDSHGANDLFVTYMKKEISLLENLVREAAEQKRVQMNSDFIINIEGVFDAFNVSSHKIYRLASCFSH